MIEASTKSLSSVCDKIDSTDSSRIQLYDTSNIVTKADDRKSNFMKALGLFKLSDEIQKISSPMPIKTRLSVRRKLQSAELLLPWKPNFVNNNCQEKAAICSQSRCDECKPDALISQPTCDGSQFGAMPIQSTRDERKPDAIISQPTCDGSQFGAMPIQSTRVERESEAIISQPTCDGSQFGAIPIQSTHEESNPINTCSQPTYIVDDDCPTNLSSESASTQETNSSSDPPVLIRNEYYERMEISEVSTTSNRQTKGISENIVKDVIVIDDDSDIGESQMENLHMSTDSRSDTENLPPQLSPVIEENFTDDFIVLGPNNTRISRSSYDSLNWSSNTLATRSLLRAVFPREVLANNTITGMPSPAYQNQNKPIKGKLDSTIIGDIIYQVMEKFQVSEKNVRRTIVCACTDESKLFKKKRQREEIQKNKIKFERRSV